MFKDCLHDIGVIILVAYSIILNQELFALHLIWCHWPGSQHPQLWIASSNPDCHVSQLANYWLTAWKQKLGVTAVMHTGSFFCWFVSFAFLPGHPAATAAAVLSVPATKMFLYVGERWILEEICSDKMLQFRLSLSKYLKLSHLEVVILHCTFYIEVYLCNLLSENRYSDFHLFPLFYVGCCVGGCCMCDLSLSSGWDLNTFLISYKQIDVCEI